MQVKIRNPHTMRWQTTALALLLAGSGCLDHADGDLSTAHSRAAALTPPQGIDVSGDQGGVVTYTYDGSGRRVLKEYAPASDGVRAVYAVGRHLDVVEREDGSLAMERYVLIGGRRAVYIPDDADGEIYHLHSDVLGSPRWITNSSGGLVRHLRYEPFGRSLDDDPPLRYRHAGEEVSERLTHLGGIRQYNSAIGRMMQPDSLIPDPANPQSLNRYTYAYNEPMAYVDPSGRFPLLPAILVVIGLFFIENDVDANIAPSVTAGLGGAALATPLRAVAVGSAVETGADTVQAIGLGIDAAITGDPNTAAEAGVAALDALSGLPTDQAEQATARRLARGQEEASSGGAPRVTRGAQQGSRTGLIRNVDDAGSQVDGITAKQAMARKHGVGDSTIQSTKSSKQKERTVFSRLRNAEDAEDDYSDIPDFFKNDDPDPFNQDD